MLLQTNSYIVPKERRAEHARLLRRFRQILLRLGCDDFEVFEQMGPNWKAADATGRFVQLMRFRDRKHQRQVHAAEQSDPQAQQLINEFCDLINLPYQQQQGLLAIGYYQSVVEVPAPSAKGRGAAAQAEIDDTPEPAMGFGGFGFTGAPAAMHPVPLDEQAEEVEPEAEAIEEPAAEEPVEETHAPEMAHGPEELELPEETAAEPEPIAEAVQEELPVAEPEPAAELEDAWADDLLGESAAVAPAPAEASAPVESAETHDALAEHAGPELPAVDSAESSDDSSDWHAVMPPVAETSRPAIAGGPPDVAPPLAAAIAPAADVTLPPVIALAPVIAPPSAAIAPPSPAYEEVPEPSLDDLLLDEAPAPAETDAAPPTEPVAEQPAEIAAEEPAEPLDLEPAHEKFAAEEPAHLAPEPEAPEAELELPELDLEAPAAAEPSPLDDAEAANWLALELEPATESAEPQPEPANLEQVAEVPEEHVTAAVDAPAAHEEPAAEPATPAEAVAEETATPEPSAALPEPAPADDDLLDLDLAALEPVTTEPLESVIPQLSDMHEPMLDAEEPISEAELPPDVLEAPAAELETAATTSEEPHDLEPLAIDAPPEAPIEPEPVATAESIQSVELEPEPRLEPAHPETVEHDEPFDLGELELEPAAKLVPEPAAAEGAHEPPILEAAAPIVVAAEEPAVISAADQPWPQHTSGLPIHLTTEEGEIEIIHEEFPEGWEENTYAEPAGAQGSAHPT